MQMNGAHAKHNVLISKYAMPLCLLAFVLLLQILNPGVSLLVPDNLNTILLQASVLGLISLGLSFVMISGETDISFAGTLGMMGAVFTMLTTYLQMNYFAALAIVILIGISISLAMAVFVTKCGFSGFIVSIAFMFIGLGIERGFNEGVTIWLKNDSVQALGRTTIGGVYMFGWIMILLFIIAFIIIRQTKYGFDLRIIGENRNAGIEAGIKADRIKVIAFVTAGLMYALSATMEPIRYGGSIMGAGQNYMLPALAACFLGSTMFTPGHVNVLGTFIGAFFMIIISNFMQLLNMDYYFTPLVQGIVLLIAVTISMWKSRNVIKQVKV